MRKVFLTSFLIAIFGGFISAEPTDITWHDYEMICYNLNRKLSFEEYETLQKDACFGEEESEIYKLFEEANEGED